LNAALSPANSTAPNRVRLFLALGIPEPVRAEVESAQLKLQRASPDVQIRWTKPEQFHITLKFLGNVEADQIDSLTESIRQICHAFAPMRLRAQDLGSFPDWRDPRVIWAGIHDTQKALLRLHSAVEDATQPFTAEKREENFAGHVTLGRIKRIRRSQAEALARLAAGMSRRFFGEWCATQMDLMQSKLGPNGAQHTRLTQLALDAGSPLDV
jgi:2'-5' RNA ligase